MSKPGALFVLIVLLICPCRALAAPLLELAHPAPTKESDPYFLAVIDDGSAHLKLKPSDNKPVTVNLWLTVFNADNGDAAKTVVAFRESLDATGNPRAYFNDAKIPAGGAEFILATNIPEGIAYSGELFASINNQQLSWKIQLRRFGVLPAFACPAEEQFIAGDGRLSVQLERTVVSAGSAKFDFGLSPFIADDKTRAVVMFADADKDRPERRSGVSVEDRTLPISLIAQGMVAGLVYEGRIDIAAGSKQLMHCPLKLVKPKSAQAELIAYPNTIPTPITLPFWSRDKTFEVAMLNLFDKTRSNIVEGLTVRLEQVSEAPNGGFDLGHLRFTLNGKVVDDLDVWPPEPGSATLRNLQAGGQHRLAISATGLKPGKYQFDLRFTAINSDESGQQKVSVTVNVRHHWGWALIALFAAFFVSFVMSKGIVNWRDRAQTRRKIRQMQPDWIRGYNQMPIVIWLRAVLTQSMRLASKTWLLPPAASIQSLLVCAERALAIIEIHRTVAEAIKRADCEAWVKYRFHQKADDIVNRMALDTLEQDVADKVIQELTAIENDLADPAEWYWADIQPKAGTLVARVESLPPGRLGDDATVKKLIAVLKNTSVPDRKKYDDAYWTLRMLYNRRDILGENKKLLKIINAGKDIDELYKVADGSMWERLKSLKDKAVILPVQGDVQPVKSEMLQPIRFGVDFKDEVMQTSFLARGLLEYTWTFTLSPLRRRWWQFLDYGRKVDDLRARRGFFDHDESESMKNISCYFALFPVLRWFEYRSRSRVWTAVSQGPRIGQFAPVEGMLSVSVSIRRLSGDPGDVVKFESGENQRIHIEPNSELTLQNSLTGGEVALFIIIAAVAILSGLATQYFANETFGSYTDFVGLLAWAVGIDQSKNLIQTLQSWKESDTS